LEGDCRRFRNTLANPCSVFLGTLFFRLVPDFRITVFRYGDDNK